MSILPWLPAGSGAPARPANEWEPVLELDTAGEPVEQCEISDEEPDPTVPQRVQLAVSTIQGHRHLGELLQFDIESRSIDLDGRSGSIAFRVPLSDPSTLLLFDSLELWGSGTLTGRLAIVNRAVSVIVNGKVWWHYILRGQAKVTSDGWLELAGDEVGAIVDDRIIGTGRRLDLFATRGHFPDSYGWYSLGFRKHGDLEVQFASPGVRGDGRCIRIRGTAALGARLDLQVTLVAGEGSNLQVTIRTSAFVKVPATATNDTTLLALTTRYSGEPSVWWPPASEGNYLAANVDEDMPRGEWTRSPIVAGALLPAPPHSVVVKASLYPASSTEWTYFDELELFRRDTLGTRVERDLVDHLLILLREAQTGRDKSTWSLSVTRGASCGISEIGVWHHDDEQPLPDALSAIVGRAGGPDAPWVGPDWRWTVAARRGSDRDDVTLGPDEIVAHDGWTHDPGSMASELRGLTDRGSDYWRVEAVARDTSRTEGMVIERVTRAPNYVDLTQLDDWTAARLADQAQAQETIRVWVTRDTSARLLVGDRMRVVLVEGHLRLDRTMRLVRKTWAGNLDLVGFDLAVSEEAA